MYVNIDNLLPHVEKPARYTGGELNIIVKRDAEVRFALCFPDVYEIGMSHLGSRILYHVLNERADCVCERAFAPWPDMEKAMRESGVPMFTLETRRALSDFQIIGFSLLYEMCYTNILTMLRLSGIPVYARDRGEDCPLVIAGGPCCCNPEPVAPFFDAVLLGDGEELIGEFVDAYKATRGLPRAERLLRLAEVEGVYVPSLYTPNYGEDGSFLSMTGDAPRRPVRRVVRELDGAPYVGKLLVPYLPIVHDRPALEIFRGCTRGCRFCQAGFIYRPLREKKKETLMEQARALIDCTGYEEISLFSLSTGDYSAIHELVPEIVSEFRDRRVSVSLPSLRIDSFLKDDLETMGELRKGGLTFAPEAGTQRLRDVINKGVTEEDLLRAVGDAFDAGWTGVKLYFMIGLPTETEEDILGIAELAKKVSRLFYSMPKEKRGKGLRLSVSASSFVPKPWTPFQWCAQDTKDSLMEKQRLLRGALKGIRGVEFSYHAPDVSVLEGVFARGDRRLAAVIDAAYGMGARFDSWDEHFKREAWSAAFELCGLDPAEYAHSERPLASPLPWEHLDMLVERDYLVNEFEKAKRGVTTRDCRAGCNGCFGERYADYCKTE